MMNLSRWKVTLVAIAAVLGLLFTLPNLLPASALTALPGFMPKKTLALGLDLQGGSSLLLEVDTNALMAERLTNMVEDVRTTLRNANINSTDLGQQAGGITVRITDPNQITEAQNALRRVLAVPLAGAAGGAEVTVNTAPDQRLRLAFVPEAFDAEAARAVEQSIEIVRRRIDQLGTKEPTSPARARTASSCRCRVRAIPSG
jgi:preprotein translocase subunit SecD